MQGFFLSRLEDFKDFGMTTLIDQAMKLILIHSSDGRLVMAEHAESGLLIFRHDNESETAFLDRARDQAKDTATRYKKYRIHIK